MTDNGFKRLAYGVVGEKYDTSKMSWTEVLEKFKELNNKNKNDKDKELTKKISSEHKQEITKLIDTLKAIKKVKTKELVDYIKSLEPVNLRTDKKEIVAEFDKFTADKNFYGTPRYKDKGYEYKINNVDKWTEIIENSRYDRSEAEKGKDKPAHKNVNEWHYFINKIETEEGVFDVIINIRDKGNRQFVYELRFKQKK